MSVRGAAAGEVLGSAATAVARVVDEGLGLVADAVAGRRVAAGLGRARGVAAAAGETCGSALRGVAGIVGAGVAGSLDVARGTATGRRALVVRGIGGVGVAVGGALLVTGGLAVGTLQELIPGVQRSRRLTVVEEQVLREVFDDAVPLRDIRIVPDRRGAGVFGLSPRAVTLGNTIYLKGDRTASLLVHECVHVWQYRRRGPRYAADAVLAQHVGHGYDWRAEVDGGTSVRWSDVNVEGQAQFLQELYDGGTGGGSDAPGAYFRSSRRDYVDGGVSRRALAEDAIGTIRGHHRRGTHVRT